MLRVIRKDFSVEMALTGLARLRKVGIIPAVMFMVGQYTETRDDVKATVQTVKESVRVNPAIECGFTITTPFPGSQLYEHLFSNGRITSHEQFYEKYRSCSEASGCEYTLVENLTRMTDEEVLAAHRTMSLAYREAKQCAK